jgi:hypothetical protein
MELRPTAAVSERWPRRLVAPISDENELQCRSHLLKSRQGHARDIIRLLNAVLTNELTSVNQYFLHARMYQNWGFTRLGRLTAG